jgi:NAD(P)-dependent dehydrogenase (short-subunit alcohol dehydrogenase family)
MEITGKSAVVTGAASGIGRATCESLLKQGIRVIGAVDRSPAVQDTASKINSEAGREVMIPFVGDVTSDTFRQDVFRELKTGFGPVHICIPAAGITRDRLAVKYNKETGRIELYPRKDMEEVLGINLIAPIYWAVEAIGTVAEDRANRGLGRSEPTEGNQGAVIYIGSVSAAGKKGQITYASAKAGLEGAQASLAKESIFHCVR